MSGTELRQLAKTASKTSGRDYALWSQSDGWEVWRFVGKSQCRDRLTTHMDSGECEFFLRGVIEGAR